MLDGNSLIIVQVLVDFLLVFGAQATGHGGLVECGYSRRARQPWRASLSCGSDIAEGFHAYGVPGGPSPGIVGVINTPFLRQFRHDALPRGDDLLWPGDFCRKYMALSPQPSLAEYSFCKGA